MSEPNSDELDFLRELIKVLKQQSEAEQLKQQLDSVDPFLYPLLLVTEQLPDAFRSDSMTPQKDSANSPTTPADGKPTPEQLLEKLFGTQPPCAPDLTGPVRTRRSMGRRHTIPGRG
jgi:hypothetical protein